MLAGNVELRRNSSPSLDRLIADVGQPPAAVPSDPTNGDAAPQQLPLSAKGSAWHVAACMLVLLLLTSIREPADACECS